MEMANRPELKATSIIALVTFVVGCLAAVAIEIIGWVQWCERAAGLGLGVVALGAGLGIALGCLYYAVQCRIRARTRDLITARRRSSIDGTSAL